jgi:hypothetical protein
MAGLIKKETKVLKSEYQIMNIEFRMSKSATGGSIFMDSKDRALGCILRDSALQYSGSAIYGSTWNVEPEPRNLGSRHFLRRYIYERYGKHDEAGPEASIKNAENAGRTGGKDR